MQKIPLIDLNSWLAILDDEDSFLGDEGAARAKLLAHALIPDLNLISADLNAAIGVQMAEVMGALTAEEVKEKLALREKETHARIAKLFEDHLASILNLAFGVAHNTIFKPGFGVKMAAEQVEAK